MDRMPQVSMPPVEMEPFDNDDDEDDELVQAESDRQYHMIPEELEEEFKEAAVKDPEPEEQVVAEKVRLDNKEIFRMTKGEPDMKVNKVKKPKRVISEEHKERLRKGRETALANRRAKAKAKKDPPADTPAPELKLEPEVKEVIKEVIIEKEINNGLSKDEVMELVSQASRKAVEDSEILRKQRKTEKLKLKADEEERKRISQVIKRATTPGLDSNNPWLNCY